MSLKFIFKALLLVLFFSIPFGFSYGKTILNVSETSIISDSQNHFEISPGSRHLLGLIPKSETTVFGLNAKPLSGNHKFVKFHGSFEYLEEQLLVKFKHNNAEFFICLVNYRKFDHIFPFHYFW